MMTNGALPNLPSEESLPIYSSYFPLLAIHVLYVLHSSPLEAEALKHDSTSLSSHILFTPHPHVPLISLRNFLSSLKKRPISLCIPPQWPIFIGCHQLLCMRYFSHYRFIFHEITVFFL